MKKFIVFALLLMISATSYSQPPMTPTPAVKTDYLKKSKNQKTLAGIIVIGGTLLVIAAVFIIPKEEVVNSSSQSDWFSGYTIESKGLKVGAGIAGTLCMLGSIPLFIAAHRNEKKGMSLSFKNEPVQQIQKSSLANLSVPSLSLNISL